MRKRNIESKFECVTQTLKYSVKHYSHVKGHMCGYENKKVVWQ